jgi:hypothetical protein
LPVYKYASLAELNAVLKQYNIVADRGSEDSRIYKSGGLVYRVLDTDGKKVGVPIKSSLIYSQPTLKNISTKFTQNEADRQKHKRRIMNAIELLLLKRPNQSLEALSQALQKEKIRVLFRQNDAGAIYGITYVDHHTKCVFNGSHLGKQYSANGLQQRCNQEQQLGTAKLQLSPQIPDTGNTVLAGPGAGLSKAFEELLQPENDHNASVSAELLKFKRKRKRIQQRPGNL